ncbi:IclR family transcription regulator (plasmid) [Natrialba magadii ATCC 43099]|uniref:IclR family transcription regulator n=1 Tax=Natrialba magadii (strain ATCC 43099 / DSM 3394 / CCM 3739 / CIP 104546 / IAM 13178 / JCM 8861 / NBRC 102185 / NCIMB 2190 / MS3) TaxID=547559 RepID=D3T1U0_NATMM|nr:IclR family transcriptional regulator [Natrialba magadii]ADD07549.1 IclR family transcription regulator [Natrialba magadii ATCC 43099]ELY26585.1 IclR family transcriptional regulator [Natrialba magadii ATCC 43099]
MSPHGNDSASTQIKSVNTTLRIVEELKHQNGATVSELATTVGVSKGTVHKHLATLREHDYVVNDNGKYRIGLHFLDIGGYALHQFDSIKQIESKVRELAERTGETVQFSTEEHGRSVVLAREAGQMGVFTRARLGKRFYMHQISGGKAILAHLPKQRVQQIIDQHGLPAATNSTITTETELFEELKAIRDRGYAFNRAESTDGLHAIGVPLIGPDGDVLGAFAVAGPSHRMHSERFEDEIPNVMQSVVNEIELNLTYS